jgi:hypothetical protein
MSKTMTSADAPSVPLREPSIKSALVGFLISNIVMTAAMVLLGSVAG